MGLQVFNSNRYCQNFLNGNLGVQHFKRKYAFFIRGAAWWMLNAVGTSLLQNSVIKQRSVKKNKLVLLFIIVLRFTGDFVLHKILENPTKVSKYLDILGWHEYKCFPPFKLVPCWQFIWQLIIFKRRVSHFALRCYVLFNCRATQAFLTRT